MKSTFGALCPSLGSKSNGDLKYLTAATPVSAACRAGDEKSTNRRAAAILKALIILIISLGLLTRVHLDVLLGLALQFKQPCPIDVINFVSDFVRFLNWQNS
jgi:hypothetical protein